MPEEVWLEVLCLQPSKKICTVRSHLFVPLDEVRGVVKKGLTVEFT